MSSRSRLLLGLAVVVLVLLYALSLTGLLLIAAPDLPDPAYLFAYFIGNGEDGLHLAWSRDSLAWQASAAARAS